NQKHAADDFIRHGRFAVAGTVLLMRPATLRCAGCFILLQIQFPKGGNCLPAVERLSLRSAKRQIYPQMTQISPIFSPICVICDICG
ncbi:MAG: hypothetical protein ACOYYJ_21955, partial [Chloroflexota bacterium]